MRRCCEIYPSFFVDGSYKDTKPHCTAIVGYYREELSIEFAKKIEEKLN